MASDAPGDGSKGPAAQPKSGSDDFDARLARARHSKGPATPERPTPMGIAFRVATELIAGVLVGTGIGWLLDRWWGTAPIMLIVFFFFGVAAGFTNVFRSARQMNADATKGPPAPSVADDEDD